MKKTVMVFAMVTAFLLSQALSASATTYSYKLTFAYEANRTASLKVGSNTVVNNCTGGTCTGTSTDGTSTLTLVWQKPNHFVPGSYTSTNYTVTRTNVNNGKLTKVVDCSFWSSGTSPYDGVDCTYSEP